ncbi:hypothetical protein ACFTZB_12795 [Rhodococcus sp. NPDC057014]|uniref:hypothetical protein n=1 Tax=Rhodococcus sp. NPDC057014 TaxID=3346000 RepID=UPI0036270C78
MATPEHLTDYATVLAANWDLLYPHRTTVERGFNRLEHWHGVANRYDKDTITYFGGVLLASTITTHRPRK